MRGQRFALARLGPRARWRRLLLRRCLPVRARNVAFFERELQLVGVEPLRMPAELCSLELPDELAHPLDAPAPARSAVRAPASSRAPRPRLPAAPATGA